MKSYLITDPKYYSSDPKQFIQILDNVLEKQRVDYLCFRDKSSPNLEKLVKSFIFFCKKRKINHIMINSHIDLAIKYKAFGVHLNSNQFDLIKKAKDFGLFVMVSCHSLEEISQAKSLGADGVTYSPIFATPNKGIPKGVKALDEALKVADGMMLFALGGIISHKEIEQLKTTNISGFASIRYFIEENSIL
ncbi:MAG: thiamine phosphate synthase [Arcobacter butzleri]|nr:thiamine phosphate synthase [Aliarcobacter butzleri]